MRWLDGSSKRKTRRFIEQQDHSIKFTFAGPPGQREANRMKQLPAAEIEFVFQTIHNLFEALGGKRCAIEQEQSKLTKYFARGISGKHRVSFHSRKDLLCIVVEN